MDVLPATLDRLPERHRAALRWFVEHAGREIAWPIAHPDGTRLVTAAKGIYKPADSPYALSVRQTLTSPYADHDPVVEANGSWTYRYHQEGDLPGDLALYTNQGLLACHRDGVPVGVLRQTKGKPGVRYEVLGLAYVAAYENGLFRLESDAPDQVQRDRQTDEAAARLDASGAFDPTNLADGRERTLTAIVRRRGQPKFRQDLIAAYGGRCAVTGCTALDVLEAAHIVPYRGAATNHPTNGLLLRADIHTLFDLGLLSVDPETLRVVVADALTGTEYAALAGRSIAVPDDVTLRPNAEALRQHHAASRIDGTGQEDRS